MSHSLTSLVTLPSTSQLEEHSSTGSLSHHRVKTPSLSLLFSGSTVVLVVPPSLTVPLKKLDLLESILMAKLFTTILTLGTKVSLYLHFSPVLDFTILKLTLFILGQWRICCFLNLQLVLVSRIRIPLPICTLPETRELVKSRPLTSLSLYSIRFINHLMILV